MPKSTFKLSVKDFRGLDSYLSRRPRARLAAFVCSLLAIVAAFIFYTFRGVLVPQLGFTAMTLAVLLGLGGLFTLSIVLRAYRSADRRELDELREERERLQDKISRQKQ